MDKFYTVTFWALNGTFVVYKHVSELSLSFKSNYFKFEDEFGRSHCFLNATVTIDEEPPADTDCVSNSDEP